MRAENDNKLGVKAWPVPGGVWRPHQQDQVDPGDRTPEWWHGEEEASASFLAAMGVVV